MKNIQDAFNKIRTEVVKTSFLQALLDTAIVFLAINLFLFLAGIGSLRVAIAAIISVGFGVFDFRYKFKSFKLLAFEKYNPEVSEMLRTAYDNRKNENIMTKILFSEVMQKLKSATTYRMVGHKRATTKILLLFLLSLSTMTLTMIRLDFDVPAVEEPVKIQIDKVEILKDDSIFGDKEDIKIGDRELQLILSSSTNINLDDLKDIEEIDFQRENFPVEVAAQGEKTSEESLPEDFDLIKDYAKRIRGLK